MNTLLAAASVIGAAAIAYPSPTMCRLENGLLAAWESGSSYDAVSMAFVCPSPESEALAGTQAVLTAVLRASASRPGGGGELAERCGGGLSIEAVGGRIELHAVGVRGTAPVLVAALGRVVSGGVSVRALVDDGSLPRELTAMAVALPMEAEAVRLLLGPAWWPNEEEIAVAARSLSPTDVERLRSEWLCANRCGVAVVCGSSEVSPQAALAPLEALPIGTRVVDRLSRTSRREAGEGHRRGEDRGQSVVVLAVAGADPFSAAAPAWYVVSHYLGSGNGSPLFRRLRSEAGLSYSTGCRWLGAEGGLLWVEAHCSPGDERETKRLLLETVRDEIRSAVDGDRYRQVCRWAATAWRRDMMSPARRVRLRAAGMAVGAGIVWPETFADAIEMIRPQDIRSVLETLWVDGLWFEIESGRGGGRS